MADASRIASTAVANACRRKLLSFAQRHHPSQCHRLIRTAALQTEGMCRVSHFSTTHRLHYFGTSTNLGLDNGEDQRSDTEIVPPGQASITLEGGWTEESDESKPEGKQKKLESELSLFTVPIVIEMPQIDEEDDSQDDPMFFVEKWHKFPGDFLEKDDVLCEIATPDFSFGMQIDDEEAGIMGKIHAKEGLKVPCNAPICTIYHKE